MISACGRISEPQWNMAEQSTSDDRTPRCLNTVLEVHHFTLLRRTEKTAKAIAETVTYEVNQTFVPARNARFRAVLRFVPVSGLYLVILTR